MYSIYKIKENLFNCSVQIQDGTETWTEKTFEEAVFSVIISARDFNGSYIRKDDIIYVDNTSLPDKKIEVNEEDFDLLKSIKGRYKYVLDHNDLRIKYRITDEECEMIIKIREGKLIVMEK